MTTTKERRTTLVLPSIGLLSKFGFNDGDEPDDLADWLEEQDPPVDYLTLQWHPVLRRLVRERLLPALDQRVEVYDVETNHNPIRASVVDGVEVQHYGPNGGVTLTPDQVEVPFADVLAMIRAMQPA